MRALRVPDVLTQTIANGRAGNMPAHGNLLSAEEIKILTAYVMKLAGSSGGG